MYQKIAVVMLLLSVCFSALYADTMLEKGAVPISIDTPPYTLSGKTVHLRGNSLPKMGDVKIEINYPAQNNDTFTKKWQFEVAVDESGSYMSDFSDTEKVGKYLIIVWSPDKKKSTTATLYVVTADTMSSEWIEKSKGLITTAAEGIPTLQDKLSQLPSSPATKEATERLEKLSNRLKEGSAEIEKLREPFKKLNEFAEKKLPLKEKLQPLYDEIRDSMQKLEEERLALEEKFRLYANKKPTRCDDVDTIVSGLEFASGSMQMLLGTLSLTGKGLQDVAIGLVPKGIDLTNKTVMDSQKDIPGADKALPTADIAMAKSLLQTAVKSTVDRKAWLKDSADLFSSTIGYISGKIFGVFCEKYSGEFTAKFVAKYYAYSKKWWSYSIGLKGTLNLRFEKGSSVDSIRVSGEFEGNAEKFTVWDDLLVETPYKKRHVIFHLTVPPLLSAIPAAQKAGQAMANEFGKMGRYGFGPYAFSIPVHGVINGEKMILEVDEPVKDYGSNVKGTAWYIMVEPALPIPYVMTTPLPMVKAGFILTKGLRKKATFDIKMDKKHAAIEKVFTRNVKADNGEYEVDWKINIKACNPRCVK